MCRKIFPSVGESLRDVRPVSLLDLQLQASLEHGAGRVTGGTFHSAGHRILRRYATLVGYTSRFGIIDRRPHISQ